MPLFSLFSAGWVQLFGVSLISLRWAATFFGILQLPLVVWFCLEAFGTRTVLLATSLGDVTGNGTVRTGGASVQPFLMHAATLLHPAGASIEERATSELALVLRFSVHQWVSTYCRIASSLSSISCPVLYATAKVLLEDGTGKSANANSDRNVACLFNVNQ